MQKIVLHSNWNCALIVFVFHLLLVRSVVFRKSVIGFSRIYGKLKVATFAIFAIFIIKFIKFICYVQRRIYMIRKNIQHKISKVEYSS